jgi:hypothetical protein
MHITLLKTNVICIPHDKGDSDDDSANDVFKIVIIVAPTPSPQLPDM